MLNKYPFPFPSTTTVFMDLEPNFTSYTGAGLFACFKLICTVNPDDETPLEIDARMRQFYGPSIVSDGLIPHSKMYHSFSVPPLFKVIANQVESESDKKDFDASVTKAKNRLLAKHATYTDERRAQVFCEPNADLFLKTSYEKLPNFSVIQTMSEKYGLALINSNLNNLPASVSISIAQLKTAQTQLNAIIA